MGGREHDDLHERVLDVMRRGGGRPTSLRDLSEHPAIGRSRRKALRHALRKLLEGARVVRVGRDRFALAGAGPSTAPAGRRAAP
ncbi:MAG: hypothetical protein ACRD6R_05360, partial [Candidatus Polarisedimenticolia bacterium]